MARAVLRDEHAPRDGGSGDVGFNARAVNQGVTVEVKIVSSSADAYGRWQAKWRKWDGPDWNDNSDGENC